MMKRRILGAVVCGVIVAAAGVATATNLTFSKQSDFVFLLGSHPELRRCSRELAGEVPRLLRRPDR